MIAERDDASQVSTGVRDGRDIEHADVAEPRQRILAEVPDQFVEPLERGGQREVIGNLCFGLRPLGFFQLRQSQIVSQTFGALLDLAGRFDDLVETERIISVLKNCMRSVSCLTCAARAKRDASARLRYESNGLSFSPGRSVAIRL